jgi:hypothetical protein
MTLKDIMDEFNYPETISGYIGENSVNENIIIYEGIFSLEHSDENLLIDGKIFFKWMPVSGVFFEGTVNRNKTKVNDFNNAFDYNWDVIFEEKKLCNGIITFLGGNEDGSKTLLDGVIAKQAIVGDSSITIEKVRFSLPNFLHFLGHSTKVENENKISKNRLKLENDDFLILIDRCSNYDNLFKELKSAGGFTVSSGGIITSKRGSINYADSNDVIGCLSFFLSFLNGYRISVLFAEGMHNGENKWIDYSDYYIDSYKTVNSWAPRFLLEDINNLWCQFYELWNSEHNDFLQTIIHWYLSANKRSGSTEGSLIMAQSALELLYNWWIVEQDSIIVGRDSENIQASNKIRLLISKLNISKSVPGSFSELRSIANCELKYLDGPDIIVQIRNAIVHSKKENRLKLQRLNYKIKDEALELCLWYIELSILKILNYKGIYSNRTIIGDYKSQSYCPIPWNNANHNN